MHGEDYVCLGYLFGERCRIAYISDVSRFPASTEHGECWLIPCTLGIFLILSVHIEFYTLISYVPLIISIMIKRNLKFVRVFEDKMFRIPS